MADKDQADEAGSTVKAASSSRPGAIVQRNAPVPQTAAHTEQAPMQHIAPQTIKSARAYTTIGVPICVHTSMHTQAGIQRKTYGDTTAHACRPARTPAHRCMHASRTAAQPEAPRPSPSHMHRITHPVTHPRPPEAQTMQRQRRSGYKHPRLCIHVEADRCS